MPQRSRKVIGDLVESNRIMRWGPVSSRSSKSLRIRDPKGKIRVAKPFNSVNVSCDTRWVDESALRRYGNRWVAVQDDGTIVADANDLDTLLTALQNLPDAKASIQRVPAADGARPDQIVQQRPSCCRRFGHADLRRRRPAS